MRKTYNKKQIYLLSIFFISVFFISLITAGLYLRNRVDNEEGKAMSGVNQELNKTVPNRINYQTEVVKPAVRDSVRWGNARCNDGSPFAFKIERPVSNRTNNWVIFLQGGGMCDDNGVKCSERPKIMTTSLLGTDGHITKTLTDQGIFNHNKKENPEFYNANKVWAWYCSSDVWSGESAVLHETSGGRWYFSGKINVRAMLEILKERYGLNDKNPKTRILFTGGSAGCIGATANAQQMVENFPLTTKDGRLKMVFDACWIPDFNNPNYSYASSGETARQALVKASKFWGSSQNSNCEADQIDQGAEPGNCFMSKEIIPYIIGCGKKGLCVPSLVQTSSIDSSALNGHGIDPVASDTNFALEEWRNLMLDELYNSEVEWIFSGGEEAYHTLIKTKSGWNYGPKNITSKSGPNTLGTLVNAFWKGSTPPQKIIWGNP